MKWPLVSRARFEDMKQNYIELKEVHERMVDRMNFVNTGFHLHKRFDEAVPVNTGTVAIHGDPTILNDPPKPEDVTPSTLRAFLKTKEAENLQEFDTKAAAAQQLNDALAEADRAAAKRATA